MSHIDRLLVLVLALGVWVLVLKPVGTSAHHSGSIVDCSWSFSGGSGTVGRRGTVDIHDVQGSVNCHNLVSHP